MFPVLVVVRALGCGSCCIGSRARTTTVSAIQPWSAENHHVKPNLDGVGTGIRRLAIASGDPSSIETRVGTGRAPFAQIGLQSVTFTESHLVALLLSGVQGKKRDGIFEPYPI
jgi:hypothetical protein